MTFSVIFEDLDGDGNLDFVVTDMNNTRLNVFLGNVDGTFKNQVEYPSILPFGSSEFSGLVSTELDHNGTLDLLVLITGDQ